MSDDFDDTGASDDGSSDDEPAEGYAWGFARQESALAPDEYREHILILDETAEEDLDRLDLSGASDYVLWAAAQAFEEFERLDDSIALLKRIAASSTRHPALYYPDILFRLAEHLKERGDYADAEAALDRVREIEPELKDRCDERRAEILVLRGRTAEGLALFRDAARQYPDEPWVPLRAGWALLATARYDDLAEWIERSERALKELKNEEEARSAASEIDRLRQEAQARRERRARLAAGAATSGDAGPAGTGPGGTGPGDAAGLTRARDEILAALDDEEARLTHTPPRSDDARARAVERLAALHARASRGWDDAVVAGDENLIAGFDELQWDVVGVAERFGIDLPEAGDD